MNSLVPKYDVPLLIRTTIVYFPRICYFESILSCHF